MAFGFPAWHRDVFPEVARGIDLHELILRAFTRLGWTLSRESTDFLSASIGVSFWSWSETIRVEILPDRRLAITSSCALPTQCFDWGKNKKNVEMLIRELQVLLALDASDYDSEDADRGETPKPRRQRPEGIQDRQDRIQ